MKYKAVDVRYHDPKTSFVEAVMSRGGREVADLVERAWRAGARFDAWTELFREEAWLQAVDEVGIDPDAIAQASFDTAYVMPWAHISARRLRSASSLWREGALKKGGPRPIARSSAARAAACQMVGVDNELAKPRVASGSNAAGEGGANRG